MLKQIIQVRSQERGVRHEVSGVRSQVGIRSQKSEVIFKQCKHSNLIADILTLLYIIEVKNQFKIIVLIVGSQESGVRSLQWHFIILN